MSDQTELQTKPDESINEEKFKRQVTEYLLNLEGYKKMNKEMKQFEANIKSYMVRNDMDMYKNEVGRITIDHVKITVFNRALVEDIKKYYEDVVRVVMRKTLACDKPIKN